MGLFDFLLAKKQTATIAKDRLRIIVAHERAGRGSNSPDYLPMLQRELLEVIRKYINVDAESVKVDLIGEGRQQGTRHLRRAAENPAQA